jgi:hypothetical protein
MPQTCHARGCLADVAHGTALCPQHRAMRPIRLIAVIEQQDTSVPLPAWVLETLARHTPPTTPASQQEGA